MTDLSALREPPSSHSWSRAVGASRAAFPERFVYSTTVRQAAFYLALVALSVFAFGWVWEVGHRGLFVLDQSIIFDGAWRVLQGQVPYRDFVMPFGPVTFWLQALAFRWAGVDFSSLVLAASVLSVTATLASVRLVWRLTRGSALLSLFGGLLTAVWFQAPFGIPWMEQTAFLFDLLALSAVVEGRLGRRGAGPWFVAAGIASVLALLSKQNAGGLFSLVCLGCLCLPWERAGVALRRIGWYALGCLLAALGFAAWLLLFSKPATFWHYWLSVSAGVGWERVAYWKILGTLTFQPLLGTSIAVFIVSSLVGLAALLRGSIGPSRPAELSLCGWLCLALPQFHSFFQLTTNNDAANNNVFIGVVAACTLWLLARCLDGQLSVEWRAAGESLKMALPRGAVVAALAVLTGVALYSVGEGMTIAGARNVQEFEGSSFEQRLAVPGAAQLRWGEPTRITPQFCARLGDMCRISGESAERERPFETLRKEDLERLASTLAARPGNFFVFPDTTLLYGLLGRPSPQPLLYFHPGQSYSPLDQRELDRQIVEALRKHDVQTVVLERASFMGTHKLLRDFPGLSAWIEHNFRSIAEFGNYRVLERVRPTGGV